MVEDASGERIDQLAVLQSAFQEVHSIKQSRDDGGRLRTDLLSIEPDRCHAKTAEGGGV
jgi:hypothetical protein